MPGASNGTSTWRNIVKVRAPNTRAADSRFGSICSMKGVITRITNGSAGNRLAIITPCSVPARCNSYIKVASVIPEVIGGIISGSRNKPVSSFLPRKLRRANVYAAGTPIRIDSTTTDSTTCIVTSSTSPSWNSCQAAEYHSSVQPLGSQVPSQRLATELVATEAIIRPTLIRKKVIRPTTSPLQARLAQWVRRFGAGCREIDCEVIMGEVVVA